MEAAMQRHAVRCQSPLRMHGHAVMRSGDGHDVRRLARQQNFISALLQLTLSPLLLLLLLLLLLPQLLLQLLLLRWHRSLIAIACV